MLRVRSYGPGFLIVGNAGAFYLRFSTRSTAHTWRGICEGDAFALGTPTMPKLRAQLRSEQLLAESAAAHVYLDRAIGARDDIVVTLNLERAFRSFRTISRGVAHGRLDPKLEQRIIAAQLGLHERLYNVAYAVAEPE
jgi:hypothetical protein